MQPIKYEDTVREVRMPLSVALDEVYGHCEQQVEEPTDNFLENYVLA